MTENKGIARVQTWIKNENQQVQNCTLKTYLVDADNSIVQKLEKTVDIQPGELFRFDQNSAPVRNPHLWSQETPYLYKVYSEVFEGTKCVDQMSGPLGFRWFSWNYLTNFLYINGKKTIVHGGNRHQEYPWVGDALPKWITEMDFKDLSENLNYNFMRTAHYPNDKLVYALTDKYGIVIDEESPSIKNQLFDKDVQQQQMKEMIRRDRNHPSIMLWSMGNETNHAVDSKWAIAEDTTRILTARRVTEGSAGEFVKHTDDNLSIENLLRCTIRGWYNKDVKDLEPEDAQHCGTEEFQMQKLIESGRFGTGNLCTWLYEVHDYGASNTVKWTLNGPATLVGPSVFESDINKHEEMDGVMYTDMPVSNVIRANDSTGKIKVTVTASGLVAGIIELQSVAAIIDNSVITEPVLTDEK